MGGPRPTSATAPHTSGFQPSSNYKATALPKGGNVYHDPQTNRTIRTAPDGRVTHITAQHGMAGTMTINRTHYGRVVETGRPGARVVNWGPHRGYVERPMRAGYYSRTYVSGGRRYAVVYREYRYHGYVYSRYVPAYYYGPRYYYWAAQPWPAPVTYAWGGPMVAPWMYAYPTYFTPAAAYASPDLWLTDYLLAENLRAAYDAQQGEADANATAAEAPNSPITPEVRAAIADEVKQQIVQEQAAAQAPGGSPAAPKAGRDLASSEDGPGGEAAPPAMNLKFFVVSSPLDVATADGQPCSLTPGDIIERRGKEPDADGNVKAEVVSSKPGDCTSDADLQVKMADLQDMHNQFRENIDAGLKVMADNDANSKGLPKAPPAEARTVSQGTCEPASDAQSTLLAQQDEASRLEAQVVQN
ncbi:MAG TPA: hypothetical protein VFB04_04695 [Terriglobales bacterium]|nr:hypothetical protein [Terriglobales bacterium]